MQNSGRSTSINSTSNSNRARNWHPNWSTASDWSHRQASTKAPSLSALKHLAELKRHGVPLLVSVSRKSLVGEVTGRQVVERGPGTLAAELWAVRQGVDWVRTHDVAALRDALRMEQAIQQAP